MTYSIVSPLARVASTVRIHDFANIYGECDIFDGAVIGAFVEIQPGVVIGKNVKVSSHSFLCTGVTICDDAFIGHGVTFINDRNPRSVFDDGTPVTASTTRVIPTRVEKRAAIGSNATIMCGVTIGEAATIGAGSVVTRDVPAHTTVCGNPARPMRFREQPTRIKEIKTMPDELIQPHNQILFDQYRARGPVMLGPYSSFTYRNDPKHLLFTFARYKFCAKLLSGSKRVIEIGCGDAVGAPILLQTIERLHGVDLESSVISDNEKRNEYPGRLTFETADSTNTIANGEFDGLVSLDVIEHIDPKEENRFIRNITRPLTCDAVAIIGTPNISSQQYASDNSRAGHINLKSHDTLKHSLELFFTNVFVFGMNDEMVHTGFSPMCHYLIAVATGKKHE